jgi:hypothetical protein
MFHLREIQQSAILIAIAAVCVWITHQINADVFCFPLGVMGAHNRPSVKGLMVRFGTFGRSRWVVARFSMTPLDINGTTILPLAYCTSSVLVMVLIQDASVLILHSIQQRTVLIVR